jgi:TfoX/Sxy family transcriptional regulator of competence genes
MASELSFVEFIADQMKEAGSIAYRKMFGEYALYCEGKVIALICDDRLFIKPTDAGKKFIGEVVEAPAYPGAKPSFLIEDKFEDREWIAVWQGSPLTGFLSLNLKRRRRVAVFDRAVKQIKRKGI